uniref:Uncharacterized protein n=1 Tax=Glossina austeni TaxID=7395 RepID=A0A1A9UV43_GLOAU
MFIRKLVKLIQYLATETSITAQKDNVAAILKTGLFSAQFPPHPTISDDRKFTVNRNRDDDDDDDDADDDDDDDDHDDDDNQRLVNRVLCFNKRLWWSTWAHDSKPRLKPKTFTFVGANNYNYNSWPHPFQVELIRECYDKLQKQGNLGLRLTAYHKNIYEKLKSSTCRSCLDMATLLDYQRVYSNKQLKQSCFES